MKNEKCTTYLMIFLILTVLSCGVKKQEESKDSVQDSVSWESIKVAAPFDMNPINVPVFPNREFNIRDFGASENNLEANTSAIAQAIEECNQSGGGKVVIPSGSWMTGKIHFKSNVNLHIAEGAELIFGDNPDDYLPAVQTSWEGIECFNYSPLIYAFECKNIAISGKGTIRPKMEKWEEWFGRPPAHMEALKSLYHMMSKGVPVEERQMAQGENHLRPHLIQFNRCENILIEDVKIRESPFWTIHLLLCNQAVVRGVDVKAHGHNNDGIDPEMTQNLLVENCTFDQGDDAIAIKAGRNHDAWRLNTPSKNIVVRNCTIKEGHQMLAIGSELSGGISNVYIHDCYFPENRDAGLRNLVFIKTNFRRGGFVNNIYVENIEAGIVQKGVLGIATDVLYQWKDLVPTYEERLTTIGDIHFKNISVKECQTAFSIKGDANKPIENISLDDIRIGKINKSEFDIENVKNVLKDGITIK